MRFQPAGIDEWMCACANIAAVLPVAPQIYYFSDEPEYWHSFYLAGISPWDAVIRRFGTLH